MRILRAADYRVMPWKNGGGTTTEIAVSPDGAGLDAFDWRVSMARVEGSGPFSNFAGIDRTLSVLEGEGISLDIAGRPSVIMAKDTEPLSFPADVPTQAALIAGPITDLNVMTRRGRVTHAVDRRRISAPLEIQPDADAALVLCIDGDIQLAGSRLGPLDTLLLERNAGRIAIEPAKASTLFVIRIDRVAGNN